MGALSIMLEIFCLTNLVVAAFSLFELISVICGKVTELRKMGSVKGAFKFNSVCVKLDIGLFKSEVLLTLDNPTISLVIPLTVPVNCGSCELAFVFNATCVKLLIPLSSFATFSTLPNPIISFVIPVTVPVK